MSDNFSEKSSKLPSHFAYTVEKGNDNKNHWQKIGAAWEAKGNGLSLQLKSLPIDGKIALRSRAEVEKMRTERQAKTQGHAREYSPKP
jgi:hypothetical protein